MTAQRSHPRRDVAFGSAVVARPGPDVTARRRSGCRRSAARHVALLALLAPGAALAAPPADGATSAGEAPAALAAPPAAGTTSAVEVPAALAAPSADGTTSAVEVRAARPVTRGVGDLRLGRTLLDAAPRQQTSEMLSAAPGFFVDHEDGEGLGNDVFLRGFDLDHGSGIEMRVGGVPINAPSHVLGQGYADANFIIPEVVHGVHVLEGTYDPHQGDAAIVGSADFELGVAERGHQLGATYGSFDQARIVGILAPEDASTETFAALSLRKTDGFGQGRAAQSGSVNAQYGVDLGASDHLRLLATAYGVHAGLGGVVREDDVNAGSIGYYDSYPRFADNQSVRTSRVVAAAAYEHLAESGGRLALQPWVTVTALRARQNFTGALESSQLDPTQVGRGDLFEARNAETAAGVESSYRTSPARLGSAVAVAAEPGIYGRLGRSDQARSLLDPGSLAVWDRRIDASVQTLDVGAYVDLDVRVGARLRLSGGPRVDVLGQSVDDHLGGTPTIQRPEPQRSVTGVAAGPRLTARYDVTSHLATQLSYGEGFRSLDAQHLARGAAPYSKVRSLEAGLRAEDAKRRLTTTLAVFNSWVENELVFVADAGGYETEGASTRRGVVGALLASPAPWLLASTALSVTDATFATRIPGISHHVPSVPPVLFRTDLTARARLGRIGDRFVTGRVRTGYTFLAGRHLTDAIVGPATHVLNTGAAVRYGAVELDVEAFNLLGLRYADDAEAYISNWSPRAAPRPASMATHLTAAPPRTILGTVTLRL